MKKQSPPSKVILIIAFGLCTIFILFGVIFGAYLYKQFSFAKESKNWPTVVGTIISSERFSVHPGGANTQAGVSYTYTVDGNKYNGDRLCFGPSITEMDERVWKEIPDYGDVTIHYHPEKPSISTIGVGFNPKDQLLLAFPGAFVVFGSFIIACMLPAVLNKKAQPIDGGQ